MDSFFSDRLDSALVPGRRDGGTWRAVHRQAAMESLGDWRGRRREDLLREFTRELVREINPSTKIVASPFLILGLVGVLWVGGLLINESRRTGARSRIAGQLVAHNSNCKRQTNNWVRWSSPTDEFKNTISLGEMLPSISAMEFA